MAAIAFLGATLEGRAKHLLPRDGRHPHGAAAASADSASGGAKQANVPVPATSLALGAALGVGSLVRRKGTRNRRPLGGGFRNPLQLAGQSSPLGALRPGRALSRSLGVACRAYQFERFSAQAMKSIMLAQAEARRLGHDSLGTETLLVGILAEGSDNGAKALQSLGVTLEDAREALEKYIGRGTSQNPAEIPLNEGAEGVIEAANACATSEGSPAVNTAHLLLATITVKDSDGLRLLRNLLFCEYDEHALSLALPAIAEQQSRQTGTDGQVLPPLDLTETLKYAEDLTQMALDGKLEPLVGRELQLERTIRILGRRSKNNPVFVGEPGVGKTAIGHGLAERIATGKVPPSLLDKKVLQLDLALLLAGTRYRGDFEERLRAVVGEVVACNRRVILMIDEVHTLVGAGSSGGEGGGMDAANMLKPALARGELQCMGATTLDEYRKYIEKDPALERRFQPVTVPEPTEEETEAILAGLAPKYEEHHKLRYTPEAIKAAVKLSSQYISDRFLPDKAIDVLDEAGSKVRQQMYEDVHTAADSSEINELEQKLTYLGQKKRVAAAAECFDEASHIKAQEAEVEERLAELRWGAGDGGEAAGADRRQLIEEMQLLKAQVREMAAAERYDEAASLKAREAEITQRFPELEDDETESLASLADAQVTEEDVAAVVAGWTGIAVEQVSSSESSRLMKLEEVLHESVVGQHEAVHAVSRSLRRARAGLRNPNRPIASFMFSGPTGVGKTQLCKTLSSTFFGAEEAMIRLDMSEFMEKHTVSKLIGSPPGYVGYDDGGTLTEAVRRKPYSLLLFDEVEKAHPDVFNVMLQLLDDGRLTDSKGRTVTFAHTLIVFTTNLGGRAVQKSATGGGSLGFGTEEDEEEASYQAVKDLVHEELKNFFRPEFLNRLDETIVFQPLTKACVGQIAEIEFRQVISRLAEQGLDISLTPRFKEHVVERGYDPAYGARPLRRAITTLLEDRLAEYILLNHSEAYALAEDEEGGSAERRGLEVDVGKDGEVEVRLLGGSGEAERRSSLASAQ